MPTNAAGETVVMAQVGTHWLEWQCLFPVVLIESADIYSIQDVNTKQLSILPYPSWCFETGYQQRRSDKHTDTAHSNASR